MKKLFFISCQLIAISMVAQVRKDTLTYTPVSTASDTNIHVYASAVVQNVEAAIFQYQHNMHGVISGYRIQIDFGQDRNAVNKVKSDFSGKYPAQSSYITYKQPYFRVSVGDFRTKLEAVCFLNKIKYNYPAAFVVSDKITPRPLN